MISIDAIALAPPPPDAQIDPMSWFEIPGDLEIEIGCGKGGFLLSRARANPATRFLGLEWKNEYFRYAADRMARWGLQNVRVMRADAGPLFTRNFPDACCKVLHLYHPDPWPKKRHHKRRLVNPNFVADAARVLQDGGQWRIQSDHDEYFQIMSQRIAEHPAFMPIPWDDPQTLAGPDFAGTNFEVKYVREGRTIYHAAFLRTPRSEECHGSDENRPGVSS